MASLSLLASTVTARAAPVPAATPAQRAAPAAATGPGAAPDPSAAPQRRRHQEGARPQPDPHPDPNLAPSPAPGLGHALAHRLPLRTNSPAPVHALALVPGPVHVPAPPLQTASTEMDTRVGGKIDW